MAVSFFPKLNSNHPVCPGELKDYQTLNVSINLIKQCLNREVVRMKGIHALSNETL